jgi:heme-degrading monooxygenase HmoA
MITEIAQIDVKPGMESEFEAGVKSAAPVFKRAKGCHGLELQRSIEKPNRYRLLVKWQRWRTTPSTSAARPTFWNGASWSAIVLQCRQRSST